MEHDSQRATIQSVAAKIASTSEALRRWVRQAERDCGMRAGLSAAEHEQVATWPLFLTSSNLKYQGVSLI